MLRKLHLILFMMLLGVPGALLGNDSLLYLHVEQLVTQKRYQEVLDKLHNLDSPLLNVNALTIELLHIKANSYEQLGIAHEAYRYLNNYNYYFDLFYKSQHKNFVDSLEKNSKKLVLENKLLQKKMNLKKSEQQILATNTYLILIGLSTFMLIYILYRLRRWYVQQQKKHSHELKSIAQQHQLTQLELQLETTLKERKKIAQRIEQEIFPLMNLMQDDLSKDAVYSTEVSDVQKLLNQSQREMTNLVRDTLPELRTQVKLSHALNELIRFIPKQLLSVQFHLEGEEQVMDARHVYQLLRMIQEFTQNALKHSKADNLQIKLQYTTTHLRLNIANNGRPMNQAVTQHGLGTMIIQNRAAEIGASLEFLDKGNTLKLCYPII